MIEKQAKLFGRTGIVLRLQTALRQELVQFHISRISLCCGFQILYGFGILLRAVAADAEKSARLRAGRIGLQGKAQRGCCRPKVPLFELGETEV